MNRILKFALVFLCLTHLSSAQKPDNTKVNCSYFGEPHLIPFPTLSYPIQNQYVCLPVGPEVLISNQFLEIDVNVALTGNHPIVQYNLTIFPVLSVYSVACVITGVLGSPFSSLSCPSGSAATAVVVASSMHVSHLTEGIIVDIDAPGPFFNIYITQPSYLVPKSKGVCVNWKCTLEIPGVGRRKRQSQTDPLITGIYNIFIDGTQQGALGAIDENVVQSRQVAFEYDASATLDQRYARTIPLSVIRSSISQYEDTDQYINYWSQAVVAAQQVICDADIQVNGLIANSPPDCKDDEAGQLCFQPIDGSDQCLGKRKK